jgi:hypothetical protein
VALGVAFGAFPAFAGGFFFRAMVVDGVGEPRDGAARRKVKLAVSSSTFLNFSFT